MYGVGVVRALWVQLVLVSLFGTLLSGAQAGLRTVAEIGAPAEDFPDGMVYWDAKSPVIGAYGHVAFIGTADVGTRGTSAREDAVWFGRPGHLRTAIREGESPEGFPASVVFDFGFERTMVVNDNGSVAFEGYMRGSRSGKAFLATNGNTTYGVMMAGDAAPDLDAGETIQSMQDISFSNAGLVTTVSTSLGKFVNYLWTPKGLRVISRSDQTLGSIYPDCLAVSGPRTPQINNRGEVLLEYQPRPAVSGAICPTRVIVVWKKGIFRKVVATGDPAPGMPADATFWSLSGGHYSFNDNGDVTFGARVANPPADQGIASVWLARPDGSMAPFVFSGEALKDRPSELVDTVDSLRYWVFMPVMNSSELITLNVGTSLNNSVILSGKPKESYNYTDYADIDSSHLEVTVASDLPPEGYGSTWYFSSLGNPVINNRGERAFSGEIEDALAPTSFFRSTTYGLWSVDALGNHRLMASSDQPVWLDGTEQQLTWLEDITRSDNANPGSTNNGLPVQLSDNGQMVFTVATSGTFRTNIVIGEPCAAQTLHRDFGYDCKADILFRNKKNGSLALWQMNGKAKKAAMIGPLSRAWSVAGIADLTGEGKTDLLLRHNKTGEFRIWKMSGKNKQVLKAGKLAPLWRVAGVADFDGDAIADVLYVHKKTSALKLWLMDGAKHVEKNVRAKIAGWNIVALADFDASGTADLLLRNKRNGKLKILAMDGNNVVSSGSAGNASLKSSIAAVADFNRDGRADLVMRNNKTGLLNLWLRGGDGWNVNKLGALDKASDIAKAADFDGDGDADLLIRKRRTGALSLWVMNGFKKTVKTIGPQKTIWIVQ